MNIIKKLFFKIDSIVVGAIHASILKGDFEEAWELSYSLAQRSHRKGNCINFAEAIHQCVEVLGHDYSQKQLIGVVELFLSSNCRSPTLKDEGMKLLSFLKKENLTDLNNKMQKELQNKFPD
ncbi:hypothetical protein [Gynuella sp.]|uniref:hypothetical protein n=1 Tax=Gynuella sp. TaxID=2969146 RepID=UPI003D0F3AD6